jgi:hypothetical protein
MEGDRLDLLAKLGDIGRELAGLGQGRGEYAHQVAGHESFGNELLAGSLAVPHACGVAIQVVKNQRDIAWAVLEWPQPH